MANGIGRDNLPDVLTDEEIAQYEAEEQAPVEVDLPDVLTDEEIAKYEAEAEPVAAPMAPEPMATSYSKGEDLEKGFKDQEAAKQVAIADAQAQKAKAAQEAADPLNWDAEQTRNYFNTVAIPKNIEERVKANVTIKVKEEQQKAAEDAILKQAEEQKNINQQANEAIDREQYGEITGPRKAETEITGPRKTAVPRTPEEEEQLQTMRDVENIKRAGPGGPGALDAFMEGLAGSPPKGQETPGLKQAHPLASMVGEMGSLFIASHLTRKVEAAARTIPAVAKLATKGKAGKFIARAVGKGAHNIATFLTNDIAKEGMEVAFSDKPLAAAARQTLTDVAFGAGLGIVGSIAKPALRTAATGAYGAGATLMAGGTPQEAITQGGLFIALGMFDRSNLAKEEMKQAYRSATERVRTNIEKSRSMKSQEVAKINQELLRKYPTPKALEADIIGACKDGRLPAMEPAEITRVANEIRGNWGRTNKANSVSGSPTLLIEPLDILGAREPGHFTGVKVDSTKVAQKSAIDPATGKKVEIRVEAPAKKQGQIIQVGEKKFIIADIATGEQVGKTVYKSEQSARTGNRSSRKLELIPEVISKEEVDKKLAEPDEAKKGPYDITEAPDQFEKDVIAIEETIGKATSEDGLRGMALDVKTYIDGLKDEKQKKEAAQRIIAAYDNKAQEIQIKKATPAPTEGGKVIGPVYHGTTKDFNAFDENETSSMGFHFGTEAQAMDRVQDGTYKKAYLDIKNPIRIPDIGWSEPGKIISRLYKSGIITSTEKTMLQKKISGWKNLTTAFRTIMDFFEAKGYDGIVYQNDFEGGGAKEDSYIAFHNEQIKLSPTEGGKVDEKLLAEIEELTEDDLDDYTDRDKRSKIADLEDAVSGTPLEQILKDKIASFTPAKEVKPELDVKQKAKEPVKEEVKLAKDIEKNKSERTKLLMKYNPLRKSLFSRDPSVRGVYFKDHPNWIISFGALDTTEGVEAKVIQAQDQFKTIEIETPEDLSIADPFIKLANGDFHVTYFTPDKGITSGEFSKDDLVFKRPDDVEKYLKLQDRLRKNKIREIETYPMRERKLQEEKELREKSKPTKEGAPAVEETPTVPHVVELSDADRDTLTEMIGEIEEGEPVVRKSFFDPHQNKRVVYEETKYGGLAYPDYFKGKGYKQKEILAILEKILAGKKVTPKQRAKYESLMAGKKEQDRIRDERYDAEERKALQEEEKKGGGGGTPGSQVPEEEGIPTDEGDRGKPIAKIDIVKMLEKKMGYPIRKGKFKQRAYGIFKGGYAYGEEQTTPDVIRMRGDNWVATAAHEVGHGLNKELKLAKRLKVKGRYQGKVVDQLRAIASKPAVPTTGAEIEEGLAQLIRYMVVDRKFAEKNAPDALKWFEDIMKAEAPGALEVLYQANKDFTRWLNQEPVAEIAAGIGKEINAPQINLWQEARTHFIDDMAPLSDFIKLATRLGVEVKTEFDAYLMARLMKGWEGIAVNFIEHGTVDYATGDINGESLNDIIEPLAKKKVLDDFEIYLVAKRAKELQSRKIATGFDEKKTEKAIEILDAKFPEFEADADRLYKYNARLLQYLKDAGVMDAETLKKIQDLNKFHVPFYRIIEEGNKTTMASGGGKLGNLKSPVKKIKGSEKKVLPPIESIIKNTYAFINVAQRNSVGNALAALSEQNSVLGQMFEEVPQPLSKVASVQFGEVIDKALGTDTALGKNMSPGAELRDQVTQIMDELGISDEDLYNIFRPSMYDPGENEMTVLRNGKKHYYVVDPALYRALMALNKEQIHTLFRILAIPASWLRAGAVLTPEFIARNPLRDQWSAYVFSQYGYVPFFDLIKGLFHAVNKTDLYYEWQRAGGVNATLVAMDRKSLQKGKEQLVKSELRRGAEMIVHPIEALRTISSFFEQGTRIGSYLRAKKTLLKKGIKGKEAMMKAAYEARELTLDFNRAGSTGRAINMISAFWNAQVQDYSKMWRTFSDPKNGPKAFMRAVLGITVPSIILWFNNHKDPRWKEIPRWQKMAFWIILTPNHVYRIPKPFALGSIFGSAPEAALDFIYEKDPKRLEEFGKAFLKMNSPFPSLTAAAPIVENWANKSLYFDAPIVPLSRKDLMPEYQYRENTSETMKALGKQFGFSPAMGENLIRGYFAGLGLLGLNISDRIGEAAGILPKPPLKGTQSDIPGLRGFTVRDPIGSASQSVMDFYEMKSQMDTELSTMKRLMKEGNIEDAKTVYKKSEFTDPKFNSAMKAAYKQIKSLQDQRKKVTKLDIDKDVKANIIEKINKQMTKIARVVVDYKK